MDIFIETFVTYMRTYRCNIYDTFIYRYITYLLKYKDIYTEKNS